MAEEEFDVTKFEKALSSLKDSQDSINTMSNWCLQRRNHHKKIVGSWLTVLKQVKVESRLTLFYLANDVIQYSKRKNYDFVDSWGTALQRATTMVRDDKVKHKISRIFRIWEERSIYNEDFLADLNGLLNTAVPVKSQKPKEVVSPPVVIEIKESKEDLEEFQPLNLISTIQNCVKLQDKTDRSFKVLPKAPDCDVEKIKHTVKDRAHVEGVKKEIDDSMSRLDNYIHSLKAEIKVRNILIAALGQAEEFYKTQRGDVKTVAIAYRNFGNRIKTMKKKLDDLTPTLPSPIPSPDINAPSPEPDDELELPGESTLSFANGFSSYMTGKLPFNINDFRSDLSSGGDRIEVIDSMGEKEGTKELYKLPPQPVPPVIFGQHHQHNFNATGYQSPATPFTGPSTSNYGGGVTSSFTVPPLLPPPMPPSLAQNSDEYDPAWNASTNWNTQPDETPSSPPFFERKGVNTNTVEYNEDANVNPGNDVDQRSIVSALAKTSARLLDVDHRNLISLTGSPGQQGGAGGLKAAGDRNGKPTSPNWLNASGGGDTDFRSDPSAPPPIFGMQHTHPAPSIPPPRPGNFYGDDSGNDLFEEYSPQQSNPSNFGNSMNRNRLEISPSKGKSSQNKNQNGQRDNVESVDMEMSDDEQDEEDSNLGMGQDSSLNDEDDNDGMDQQNQMAFMNYPPPPPVPPSMPRMNPWEENNNNNGMMGMGNNNGNGNPNHNNNMHNNMNNNNNNWNYPPMRNMGPPRGGPCGPGDGGFFNGPPLRGPPPFGPGNFRNRMPGRGMMMPMNNGNFRPRVRGGPPFRGMRGFRGNMRGGPPPMW